MIKKALLFALLAFAALATPIASALDIPIPACFPCSPGEPPVKG